MEFARDKSVLFDRWCQACDIASLSDLTELILLEEFKKCLPDRIVVYLNEQKVASLTNAAVLADEFILTHKSIFTVPSRHFNYRKVKSPPLVRKNPPVSVVVESHECYYCHEVGHLIAGCPVLKRKGHVKSNKGAGGVGFIETASALEGCADTAPESEMNSKVDACFKPFMHLWISCICVQDVTGFEKIAVRFIHSRK